MTKLERLMERIRALPADEQERILAEIDFLIAHPPDESPALTPEQEAELRRRLTAPDDFASDDEVETFFARLNA